MNPSGMRKWRGVGLGLVLLGLAGCGARVYPVKGQLQYEDGKPVKELAGETVTFTSAQLGKSSHGTIAEDGTFQLTSHRTNDGAYPGTYKVIVTQPHPNYERRQKKGPVLDVAYENPDTTDLERTVEPKENEFTFKLRRVRR
jgi:hypothetical protein